MITRKTGDILAEPAEALVNTVNCVGVMGRGVALQFRNAFPDNFRAYQAACARGELRPGRMLVFERQALDAPRWIINFPTKRHWRGKSRMEDIEAGLAALVQEIRARDIRSIAVPPLGCGLGGLDWGQVRPRIEAALGALSGVSVTLFEPAGAPEGGRGMAAAAPPRMTPGRAALIGLMRRYLAGVGEPFVTLLELHKLMYFLQEAGEPLRLRFAKAPAGPFAENLGKVLQALEGHYLEGYRDGGDAPGKEITILPGAAEDAEVALAGAAETGRRFARVAELVEGFETPFGLELLATVHWVAKARPEATEEEVTGGVRAWGPRKRGFSDRQIGLALERLRVQGWLEPRTA
ncbi:macro domain-containing protein [Roseomonas alkaliterrae]|jgi:O-acetyl-ADP-ribose deacetylase (regulator of RNase III)|uniref:Macro domain-containing protein n=1 Tax=Caldovatus aquaticus TaxID=2865671 RepID=A0ABS7F3W4_9PROT|nr:MULTISPECIES: macro domain-containing protein [Acetobacteraceae]MBR0676261.1 macro domain-containing protein [Neoroseomonas alkaliterrae]MBW8269983.1 macro domain-containing protein [Caldovatus aquaticus]